LYHQNNFCLDGSFDEKDIDENVSNENKKELYKNLIETFNEKEFKERLGYLFTIIDKKIVISEVKKFITVKIIDNPKIKLKSSKLDNIFKFFEDKDSLYTRFFSFFNQNYSINNFFQSGFFAQKIST
jgi:hypothetical protein